MLEEYDGSLGSVTSHMAHLGSGFASAAHARRAVPSPCASMRSTVFGQSPRGSRQDAAHRPPLPRGGRPLSPSETAAGSLPPHGSSGSAWPKARSGGTLLAKLERLDATLASSDATSGGRDATFTGGSGSRRVDARCGEDLCAHVRVPLPERALAVGLAADTSLHV